MNPGDRHVVIGTAGHIDHGKTVLVKALTGVDTDRLPEEKKRGISIDLGFADFNLPSGRKAAVVDVPGHERFIKNMLAGATGIDLALMVVAADEGVMPQTREHLDILNLLGVRRGVVALTKADLVEEEWLSLVRAEVAEEFRGSFLEGAPTIAVSAFTGRGLDELVHAIDEAARGLPGRAGEEAFRMPVDRVFSVAGFGTVVTGTVVSGRVRAGAVLELVPSGKRVKVRGIQVHGARVEGAEAGQRAALNLAGAERSEIRRGNSVAEPGYIRPERSFTGSLRLLPSAAHPLKNGSRVHLYAATEELTGRLVLLDREELSPGEECYVRFRSERPFGLCRGDRFIVRSYSPMVTIGGGRLLETGARRRRYRAEDLEELAALESASPRELALMRLARSEGPLPLDEVARHAGLSREDTRRLMGGMPEIIPLEENYLLHRQALTRLGNKASGFLEAFFRKHRLRRYIPKEQLRSALLQDADLRVLNALLRLLEGQGILEVHRDRITLPGREPALNPREQEAARALEEEYLKAAFLPPPFGHVFAATGLPAWMEEEMAYYMVEQGILVRFGEDMYMHSRWYEEAWRRAREHIKSMGSIAVSELRDILDTSRKYAVPLMEHFDAQGLTRRMGDRRVLGDAPGTA